jgi:FkbM family methyltransferase
MLIDVIRDLVPIKVRQNLGLWTIQQAGRSRLVFYPYFWLLCGGVPKNLVLDESDCYVRYEGRNIYSPRDGILAFIEVFQDKLYEKHGGLKEGDVVVDVGAYVGMFTVRASKLVGPKGQVVAIEPSSSNRTYLRANVSGLENVEVLPIAASNWVGWGKLGISGASICHSLIGEHSRTEEVQVNTLDLALKLKSITKIDFLKIDAEGSELEILQGAETLLKGKVRLAIGAYHHTGKKKEYIDIIAFLKERGYKTILEKGYVYAEK